MYRLEHNGYFNVTGLKREFAIEVSDYTDKEKLLHEIFGKSRVPNSELFAIDIALVKQLLSSLEGKQVYPIDQNKETVFEEAAEEVSDKVGTCNIPDGEYYMEKNVRGFGKAYGKARIENGIFTVLKGSV